MARPKGTKYTFIHTGRTFGKWTVTDSPYTDQKGRAKVEVTCECGNVAEVYAYKLMNSKSTQCKKCSSGKSPTISSFSNYVQRSAVGRGVIYELDSSFLSNSFSEQSYSCAVTGEPISPSPNTTTVVQIDGTSGLIPGNTVLVNSVVGTVIQNSGMGAAAFTSLAQTITQNIQQSGTKNPIVDFFNRREQE